MTESYNYDNGEMMNFNYEVKSENHDSDNYNYEIKR